MFQALNRKTINCTLKVAVSFKIIMTMSVIRPCFTTQHQTCKTNTAVYKTKTETDLFGLRPVLSQTTSLSRYMPLFCQLLSIEYLPYQLMGILY